MEYIELFTDGSCSPNPGKGGWGIILKQPSMANYAEFSGNESNTTNNRMELTAVVRGLKLLKAPCQVKVVTDSRYVISVSSTKCKVKKNHDLVAELLHLCKIHTVEFEWVHGHIGHTENERCDQLAVTARNSLI